MKHFEEHTKARTRGTHQLLIINSHESHNLIEFQNLCEEYKIITVCMPSHLSHLLQPLDVGCFGPLKKAYGNQISALARAYITHIAKEDFLPAFRAAYNQAFIESNI